MHKQKNTEHLSEPSFHNLGLDAPILKVLDRLQFHTPTPIQAQAIPDGLKGEDIIGVAQTGTGKTLAFSLPIIQRLIRHGGRGLILLPTRELALQVKRELDWLYEMTGASVASCVGGMDMRTERRALDRGAHIVVGRP